MDELIRDHFSRDSESYNNYTKKSHSIKKEVSNWQKLYASVLGEGCRKILNVGCGPGTEAILLAGMGYEVTALDFSPSMVELTKNNAAEMGVSLTVVEGDAEQLPFDDGTFDAVVSNYALWAIPHPQTAIDEWYRVLRQGGQIAYIDGVWSTAGFSPLRKLWFRLASKLRKRDDNSHRVSSTPEEKERLSGLWSVTAQRPNDDLRMVENAGFRNIRKIDKVDRRIFSGMRYVEYGYHKVHFMIIGYKG